MQLKVEVLVIQYYSDYMSNPRPAWGPVEGFVRPSLNVRCSKSAVHADNLSFTPVLVLIILNLTF